MKRINILFAALLLPTVLMAQPGMMMQPQPQRRQNMIDEQLQKLLVAETAITSLYVEDVDQAKLIESAIKGMLEELDPHSTYLTPEENDKSNETLMGSFDGIGVQFNMVEDTLFIVQPIPDGPSERAGILAGDRIVTVNDTAIAGVGMSQENIMKRLRGPRGTKVDLGIVRRGVDDVTHFTIIRDKIPVNSVDAAYMISPGIGYIKVSNFGATTVDEFEDKLKYLQGKGLESLILDLQGNGGGFLMAAVGIANEFLNRDQLVVYTEGKRSPRSGFVADGSGRFKTGRLAVLIDEYSASASEIVSGAVQDWDRATIVGRRSFGKGLVQRPVELHDGSLIRLTVAKYYTPVGRCIQKRVVYGGGGIMPDVFVPLDTTRTNKYYRNLTARNVVLQTAMQYTERNRRTLQRRYRDFESFNSGFETGPDVLALLLSKASDAKIEFNREEYEACLPIYRTQLKAMIARNLWGMNEYYQVIQTLDETVQRAVELLKTGQ